MSCELVYSSARSDEPGQRRHHSHLDHPAAGMDEQRQHRGAVEVRRKHEYFLHLEPLHDLRDIGWPAERSGRAVYRTYDLYSQSRIGDKPRIEPLDFVSISDEQDPFQVEVGSDELPMEKPQEAPQAEIQGYDAERLAEHDEREARVVELRYFGGLKVAEVAEVLGVSKRTVEGLWTHARAWLMRELSTGGGA